MFLPLAAFAHHGARSLQHLHQTAAAAAAAASTDGDAAAAPQGDPWVPYPALRSLLSLLTEQQSAWQAAAPVESALQREIGEHLALVAKILAPPAAPTAGGASAAASAAAAASAEGSTAQELFPRQIDYPGQLSARGPRHDNDHADFRDVSVGPTEGEVLAERPPYLPSNDAGFEHHSEGVDRLLDTHFRLLRHDLLAPLLEAMRALRPGDRRGGAGQIRGNRLTLSAAAQRAAAEAGRKGKNDVSIVTFTNVRVLSLESESAGKEGGAQLPDFARLEVFPCDR